MRSITLTRTEGEWLVDLLEDCNMEDVGTWRFAIAEEIRETFGMPSREKEIEIIKKQIQDNLELLKEKVGKLQ